MVVLVGHLRHIRNDGLRVGLTGPQEVNVLGFWKSSLCLGYKCSDSGKVSQRAGTGEIA